MENNFYLQNSQNMIKQRQIFNIIESFMDSPEAIIITGMHRTGKTTVLNYLFERISTENKVFLRLENPINRRYFEADNYEEIKSVFELLGLNLSRPSFVFLDDIQFTKNLPSVASYFIDRYKVKFLMTCSGNFYANGSDKHLLPGRKYIFELSPLNFREFLLFKDTKLAIPEIGNSISKNQYDTIMPYYREYIDFGGFPGVLLKDSSAEKKRALEEIFSSFYQLVAIQLGDRRHALVIRDLMLLLMNKIGTRLDVQKMSQELNISRPTLHNYLSFLQATYYISLIKPFSRKRSNEIRKMPKVYLCDSGLANLFASDIGEKCLFENSVYQSLKDYGRINYYYRKSGVNIDFIIDGKKAYDIRLNPKRLGYKKMKSLAGELGCIDFNMISKNHSTLDNVIYGFML